MTRARPANPDPHTLRSPWRSDFPLLARRDASERGDPGDDGGLAYLDSGASTQKPAVVIDAVADFYRTGYANIHRGAYALSADATNAYEATRAKLAKLIHADGPDEIVFLRGTTEAINLVAQAWGRTFVKPGQQILISAMEHHANIVPWQMLCEQVGARLAVIPMDDAGVLDLDACERLLKRQQTALVAVAHISNALGTINPVAELARLARGHEARVLIDGAQAIAHAPLDVQALDADFYAFSGHKMYGPTGIGALYAKRDILAAMPPWQGGGDMIRSVSFEGTTYADPPARFEAGTPDIAGAVGLGAAVDYLQGAGLERIGEHEHALSQYMHQRLAEVPRLRLIGNAPDKAGIASFVLDGVHAHDVATVLDFHGVAVRAGHHCAEPVLRRFGLPATVRASLGIYNDADDIDALIAGLSKAVEMFAP